MDPGAEPPRISGPDSNPWERITADVSLNVGPVPSGPWDSYERGQASASAVAAAAPGTARQSRSDPPTFHAASLRREGNEPWCPRNPAALDSSANQFSLQKRSDAGPEAVAARRLRPGDIRGTSTWLASGDGGKKAGHRVWMGDLVSHMSTSDLERWCVDDPCLGPEFMQRHCLDLSVTDTAASGATQAFTTWTSAESAAIFYEAVHRWYFAVPPSLDPKRWRWVTLRHMESRHERPHHP